MSGEGLEVVHRLGMTVSVVAAVVCAVMAVREARRERVVRRRAGVLLGAGGGMRRSGGVWCGGWVARWGGGWKQGVLVAGVVGAGVIFVGGVAGVVVGLAVGCGLWRWQRRQEAAVAERVWAAEVRAGLATGADLLGACLAAGAGPRDAAEAVGRSLGGAVGERLRQVAAELRLGGEPAVAWGRLAVLPGARGLALCMERAGISGVPAVDSVTRIATELRAEWGRAAATRARRAGVLVTLPLAACFLPAFLALGVAPVLVGLADGLLGRG